MENNTFLFISSPYIRQSVATSAGIANPDLAAGLLLGYFFLGLAIYIWAFWSQRSRLGVLKEAIKLSCSQEHSSLRGVQNIYGGMCSALLIDVGNGIIAIILAIGIFGYTSLSELSFSAVFDSWYLFRAYGLIFHLTNAFVCLLFLCHPQWRIKLRFVYTVVIILFALLVPFYLYFVEVTIFGLGTINIALGLAIIAKRAASTTSPSAAAARKIPVVVVAMLTFFIVFAPSFVLECLIASTSEHVGPIEDYLAIYVTVLLCTNLQLPMNGLLCYVIMKLPSEEEELQQQQQQQQQHESFENSNYDSSANVIT